MTTIAFLLSATILAGSAAAIPPMPQHPCNDGGVWLYSAPWGWSCWSEPFPMGSVGPVLDTKEVVQPVATTWNDLIGAVVDAWPAGPLPTTPVDGSGCATHERLAHLLTESGLIRVTWYPGENCPSEDGS